jgi:hypothetical protein
MKLESTTIKIPLREIQERITGRMRCSCPMSRLRDFFPAMLASLTAAADRDGSS